MAVPTAYVAGGQTANGASRLDYFWEVGAVVPAAVGTSYGRRLIFSL
jgi:hypothetical protein